MSLAGLAATLMIIVLALIIVRKLQVRCIIEDCLLSGKQNCSHIVDKIRVSRLFSAS